MSSQYRTPSPTEQEAEEKSRELIEELEKYLGPLLVWLDAYLDIWLVRTFVRTLVAIIRFCHGKQGLLLSELGAYIADGAHAPAGTKRLSRLLHSIKWGKGLMERFLWERADERLEELEKEGKDALCIWDGSVLEKPESEKGGGLCAVRSSKARRLRKNRKGVFNPPGGKPITVLGMEWLGVLICGIGGEVRVAHMSWWTRKGEHATNQRKKERDLLWENALGDIGWYGMQEPIRIGKWAYWQYG
jgi:hypothetical protein